MKRCPKCQNLLPVDARFCMQCGQAFDGGSAPSMPTARPLPPARKPWWIAVVVGVLLLAGIGFGASSLLKASGRPGPSDLLKSQGAPQGDLLRAAAKPAPDMDARRSQSAGSGDDATRDSRLPGTRASNRTPAKRCGDQASGRGPNHDDADVGYGRP